MRKISYLLLLLGLVITQTVKAENTAKAICTGTADNTTMTFVYDEATYNVGDDYGDSKITNVLSGDVSSLRNWINTVSSSSSLTKVVFAGSFKDARPTSCQNWFRDCINLKTIEGLSNLNTSQVTDMSFMFHYCSGLTTLDLSSLKTGLVTDMAGMFYKCSGLTTLDLSSFDTSKVTTMRSMFNGCTKLTTLDLSSFNTGKVETMYRMFYECSNLTTIVVGDDWKTDAVTASDASTDMFKDCSKLKGGNETKYDSNNPIIDVTYAHIDGGETYPGYLTNIDDFFKLEITSAGMATLYYDKALIIPAGVKVYYCIGIDETKDYNVITKEITDAILPANTGVFLSGNKGHYLFRKTTDAVTSIGDNIMEGKTTNTTVAPREVLTLGRSKRTGIIGFNYYNGTTIPAYKAYIPADEVPANAPAISFFPIKYFEDEATGISKQLEVSKVEDDAIYDLAGRKVKAATKGIFIKNGKKFIVK